MKTPPHIMNSNAKYEKSTISKLLTSFNRIGHCMSYRETKQQRNNFTKLGILNNEPYGIPLPTYFLQTQFKSAAIDNSDQCDVNVMSIRCDVNTEI